MMNKVSNGNFIQVMIVGTTCNECAPKIFFNNIIILPYPYSKYELVLYITGLNEIPSKVFNASKMFYKGRIKNLLKGQSNYPLQKKT
jgi:hypothetical protein